MGNLLWSSVLILLGFQTFGKFETLYEENEQVVNDIYFRTIAADNYDFMQAQIDALADIAYQCPLAGGAAVYRARGMYQTAIGFVFFDDHDLCEEQNISWRKPAMVLNIVESINIFPNPANDVLNVNFTDKYVGQAVYIYNSLGQNVKSFNLPSRSENIYQVSISNLGIGIYYIKVEENYSQKLIIQH